MDIFLGCRSKRGGGFLGMIYSAQEVENSGFEREERVVCALQGVLGSYKGKLKEKGLMIFFLPTGREI